jgi:hypothetical protein
VVGLGRLLGARNRRSQRRAEPLSAITISYGRRAETMTPAKPAAPTQAAATGRVTGAWGPLVPPGLMVLAYRWYDHAAKFAACAMITLLGQQGHLGTLHPHDEDQLQAASPRSVSRTSCIRPDALAGSGGASEATVDAQRGSRADGRARSRVRRVPVPTAQGPAVHVGAQSVGTHRWRGSLDRHCGDDDEGQAEGVQDRPRGQGAIKATN